MLHALVSILSRINFRYPMLLPEITSSFLIPCCNCVYHHLLMAFGRRDERCRGNLRCAKNSKFNRSSLDGPPRMRRIPHLRSCVREKRNSRAEYNTLYSLWTKLTTVDMSRSNFLPSPVTVTVKIILILIPT